MWITYGAFGPLGLGAGKKSIFCTRRGKFQLTAPTWSLIILESIRGRKSGAGGLGCEETARRSAPATWDT